MIKTPEIAMYDIKDLQDKLHHEIPLSQAMGIKVAHIDEQSVKLSAPLDRNINHKHTAFGGSLYSVCVLSGWSMVYVKLSQAGLQGHIVIQESNIQYLKPVTSDFESICQIENQLEFARALKLYSRKGKARFILKSVISEHGNEAVVFQGKYVVHR